MNSRSSSNGGGGSGKPAQQPRPLLAERGGAAAELGLRAQTAADILAEEGTCQFLCQS